MLYISVPLLSFGTLMLLLNSVRILRPIQLLNISLFNPSSLKTGNSKNFENSSSSEFIKINKKIYAPHRVKPFEIKLWKSNKTNYDKELIIFMP